MSSRCVKGHLVGRTAVLGPFLWGLVVPMVTIAAPAAGVGLPQWEPSHGWSVQMQGEHCVAGRTFDWNSRHLQLVVEANPTGLETSIRLITQGTIDGYGWIYADLAIGKHWMKHIVVEEIPSIDPGHIIYKWDFSADAVRELASAQQLVVVSDPLRLVLPVRDLDSVNAQLRDCDSKLLARWGFTPEDQAKIERFPVMKSLESNKADYPAKAEMRDAVGNVDGYVTVGVDGKASNCHVIDSSGWSDFDSRTCELMVQRGVFTPASDKSGNPIAALYYFQWEWTSGAG